MDANICVCVCFQKQTAFVYSPASMVFLKPHHSSRKINFLIFPYMYIISQFQNIFH